MYIIQLHNRLIQTWKHECGKVAIFSVKAARLFSQQRRDKGRDEGTCIDGEVEERKEGGERLLLSLFKLITAESTHAGFYSASSDSDQHQADEVHDHVGDIIGQSFAVSAQTENVFLYVCKNPLTLESLKSRSRSCQLYTQSRDTKLSCTFQARNPP